MRKCWKPFFQLYGKSFDLFHITHQNCRYNPPRNAKKKLITIHDVNFEYDKQGKKQLRHRNQFLKQCEQGDYAAFITNFVQEDVKNRYNFSIPSRVIYNGVYQYQNTQQQPIPSIEKLASKSGFLFHISRLSPNKNIMLLVDMMAHLENETLVVAGNWQSNYGQEVQNRIKSLNLKNIICLGTVTQEQKAWLYSKCKAFLFPSMCEGFGLPPIEAMMFGKPTFVSALTSLPEVCGQDTFYWHDLRPYEMAQIIKQKLNNLPNDLPQKLKQRAQFFSWEKCYKAYLDYYLDILNIKH